MENSGRGTSINLINGVWVWGVGGQKKIKKRGGGARIGSALARELINQKHQIVLGDINITKLKKDFNWKPKFSITDGLTRYFKWINKLPIIKQVV